MGSVPRVTEAVSATLISEGYRVRVVSPRSEGARKVSADRFEADLSDPVSVATLHELVKAGDDAPIGALINFLGLAEAYSPASEFDIDAPARVAQSTFNLLKEFQDDLDTSAKEEGGWVLNVTGLGGAFGLGGACGHGLSGAGTLGILKTFLRESPRAIGKNIDVDPEMDANLLATRLVQELGVNDNLVEVGLTPRGRQRLELVRDEGEANGTTSLDRDSVVIVTGGAYGVTADVARGLAKSYAPRLILLGRSALPELESTQTAGLDAGGLRKYMIQQAKDSGKKMLPADIEKAVQRRLRDRQILSNIADFTRHGSEVEYHALDVRDREAFGSLIDSLYSKYGRIDGVVHGAGVIEDKRIRDKSIESFTNVFRTKVDSALILAEKLRPQTLQFLVFFSSVSGRFGNAGQADYSAANEYLNKLADLLDSQWPARVAAINWGPWDGGMVSDELRRMYAQVGFDLIPIDEGVDYFLSEIRRDERRSSEIVVSGSVAQMANSGK